MEEEDEDTFGQSEAQLAEEGEEVLEEQAPLSLAEQLVMFSLADKQIRMDDFDAYTAAAALRDFGLPVTLKFTHGADNWQELMETDNLNSFMKGVKILGDYVQKHFDDIDRSIAVPLVERAISKDNIEETRRALSEWYVNRDDNMAPFLIPQQRHRRNPPSRPYRIPPPPPHSISCEKTKSFYGSREEKNCCTTIGRKKIEIG